MEIKTIYAKNCFISEHFLSIYKWSVVRGYARLNRTPVDFLLLSWTIPIFLAPSWAILSTSISSLLSHMHMYISQRSSVSSCAHFHYWFTTNSRHGEAGLLYRFRKTYMLTTNIRLFFKQKYELLFIKLTWTIRFDLSNNKKHTSNYYVQDLKKSLDELRCEWDQQIKRN